jgi:hypothetical protein
VFLVLVSVCLTCERHARITRAAGQARRWSCIPVLSPGNRRSQRRG